MTIGKETGHRADAGGTVAILALSLLALFGSVAAYSQGDPDRGGGARGASGGHGPAGPHGTPSGRGPAAAGPRATPAAHPSPGGLGHGQIFDDQYHHGYYYPSRGTAVRTLPPGYRPFYFHGRHYYFFGGIWYEPGPLGFVVISPPIGLFLTVLPPYYTTLWFNGVPYYYADDTYYQWDPDMSGYVVVPAPPGSSEPGSPPPAASQPAGNLFIYPKNGQNAAQQAADRYECDLWARNQVGSGPTQGSGAPPDQIASKTLQYNRAMTACLEARGYSVD